MERDRVYLPKNPSLPTVPSQLATLPCFFAILESSFDGIFITNGQAVPIWVNHSYEVISGLSARDVLGIPMDELVRRGLISNSATLQALEIGHSYTANQSFVTGKQALAQAPSLRAAARLAQMDPATFLRRKKKYQALGLLSPEE